MAGTGNVCYHYSLELGRLGHDVTVFTSLYPKQDYEYPKYFQVQRFNPLFKIGNAPFIPQLLNLEDFDIIHLHTPFFFGNELVYLLSKLKHQKYVITYHNDVIFQGFLQMFSELYNKIILQRLIKNAEKICVTSFDYAINSNIKYFIQKRMQDIIEVPNGVDINKFNQFLNCNGLKELHKIKDKKVILFVGAMDKAHMFKGIEKLLKSISKIHYDNFLLLLIGDGDLKPFYMNLSKKLSISDKTLFVGRVSNDDLPKYFALSDMVVLPSTTMGEAFGLVLVEGMACGKAVIASNLPGVRTVVDDGINGFLVESCNISDLGSKISYLLKNESLRMNFGSMGRKKVEEKYSWEKIGKKLENVYQEIIL